MTRTAAAVLVIVAVGWAWEVFALSTRRIPTITEAVHAYRGSLLVSGLVVLLIVASAGWAIAHLIL